MSNDIIARLKSDLAIIGGVDEDTRAVAGSGGGTKRISIKGGVFRKYAGGKEIGAIEDRHMNIIFVRMAPTPSRTYYTGAYKEGEKVSPTCWSTDSKVPDAEVKNPQATACDKCQFSIKGSGQGGTGSACRLSWRTAVVLPQDPGGDVMQLTLPATSAFGAEDSGKWPFRPYVQMLANNNISAGMVITKMQFDTKSPVPKLLFSPVSIVPQDDMEVLKRQRDTQAAEMAVKLTVYQADKTESVEVAEVAQPVLRDAPRADAPPAGDVTDIVKKWSKK